MNESQSLEVKLKSNAEDAVSGFNKLLSTLNLTGSSIQKISTKVDANGNLVNKTLTSVNKKGQKVYTTLYRIGKDGTLQNTTFNMRKLGDATNNTSKMFSKLTSAISLTGLFYGVRKLATTFLTWMTEATDRTEQLNLFNVVFDNMEKNGVKTFSKLGKEAIQFQNKLNYAFGTNLTDTLKYQALFQSMGENASIPKEYASVMSETMTKFTYDLASLYNKKESDVAEALRAGVYAGQTKPLRAYGIDVTQSTMQPLLESLGITDRGVKDLSQGEKEILRYLAALKQAKVAMGDYADTIESPSNQMKIFSNLLVEAKVALTSLFMGTFSKVLPYANAFLLVVREICNVLANLLGIELSDFNSGIASSEDAFVDLDDSISDATDSVKELKRQTLGFDQINNINENKDKNNDYSLNGGIDQRLLDAIYGYDNGMDKVKMKATEIYEKMMGWLGFIKEIDPLTGKVSWKLDNTNSTMGKLLYALKDIVIYGKDAIKGVFEVLKRDFDSGAFGKVLVTIFEKLRDLFKYIASNKKAQTILAKLVETFILFKTVKTILTPLINVWKTFTSKIKSGANLIQTFGKQLKGTNNYILDSEGNLKEYNKTLDKHKNVVLNADESVNKWQTGLNRAKTALVGIGMSVSGLYMVHDAIKDIVAEGPNVVNVLEGITGSLSTIGGFATIGSIFGPIGTAIGVVAGVVATLITSTETAKSKMEELIASGTVEGMKDWEETLSSAKSHLSEFNDYLFASDDEIAELQTNMEDIQTKITEITKRASAERRDYTEEEIKKLNEYFDELEKLNDRQLAIQQAKTDAILQQAKITAENNQLSLEEYKACASEWIKTATEQKDNMISIISEQTTNELVLLNQRYGDEANLANEAYKKEYEAIMKRKEERIQQANDEIGEIYAIYTEGYLKKTGLDERLNAHIKGNLQERKSLEESHQRQIVEIMENSNLTKEEKNKKATELNEEYNKEMKRINGEIALGYEHFIKSLSEEEQKQLGILIAMGTNTEVYGGQLDEKTQSFITSVINAYGQMPKKTKNVMKDVLDPMMDEMEKKEPVLVAKAKSLGKGILTALRNAFDIHSPSKKTRDIFRNVMLGMLEGIDVEENSILNKINSFSKKITDSLNTDLNDYKLDFSKDFTTSMYGNINSNNSIDVSDSLANKISGQLAMVLNNQVINVQLDAHTDEGVVIDRINQTTRQTGVCPINIPF